MTSLEFKTSVKSWKIITLLNWKCVNLRQIGLVTKHSNYKLCRITHWKWNCTLNAKLHTGCKITHFWLYLGNRHTLKIHENQENFQKSFISVGMSYPGDSHQFQTIQKGTTRQEINFNNSHVRGGGAAPLPLSKNSWKVIEKFVPKMIMCTMLYATKYPNFIRILGSTYIACFVFWSSGNHTSIFLDALW